MKLLSVIVNSCRIATITMKNPPANCINLELLQELKTVLNDFEGTGVKGMILTSYSDRIFSSGLDLNLINKANKLHVSNALKSVCDLSFLIHKSSIPTVALITGHARGTGCIWAFCCEYRIMVNKSTFALNEVSVGIPVPLWVHAIVENVVGYKNADNVTYFGKIYDSDSAYKMGIVDDIVVNRTEGLLKANAFFNHLNHISSTARSISKLNRRTRDLELLEKTKVEDTEKIVNYIMQPEFQLHLENYIKKLKENKASKL